MATVSYTQTNVENGTRAIVISWLGLTTTDLDGQWFESVAAFFSEKSVQVVGNFSGGAIITFEGSNIVSPSASDGSVLHARPQGIDLVFDRSQIWAIEENPVALRPVLTLGDGSADLDVHLFCLSSARH